MQDMGGGREHLEVAELEREQRAVEEGLEHVRRERLRGVEVGARRLHLRTASAMMPYDLGECFA